MTEREALKLALEALQSGDYWKGVAAVNAIKEALAQPEQEPCEYYKRGLKTMCLCGMKAQPEQEPVAWLHTKIEGVAVPHRPADLDKHPDRWEALYKAPPPCPTCEALTRTVMLDQTSHDTTPPQRTWVGLTDDDLRQIILVAIGVAEAKLKEKNT